jgi:hypothetical protein
VLEEAPLFPEVSGSYSPGAALSLDRSAGFCALHASDSPPGTCPTCSQNDAQTLEPGSWRTRVRGSSIGGVRQPERGMPFAAGRQDQSSR